MSTLHIVISTISLVLYCVGMRWFFASGHKSKISLSFFAAYCLLYLLYAVFYAVCYYFTGQGIDYSVLYHIKYGLVGAGYGEYSNLIISCFIFLLFSFVAIFYFLFSSSGFSNFSSRFFRFFSLLFLLLSAFIHPATADLYMLSRTEAGELFSKYYRTPFLRSSGITPKNFIFIYAESLERTYFDEQVFPGLIKYLRDLEVESIAFSNIGQYPETGWTIAGMVASQCGLPLIAPSHGNSMGGMDTFLAGADCMGDLLKGEGYHLVFMGGASLKFAGKGKFYRTHGFDEVLGKEELVPFLPKQSYQNSWGLYDDSLFDIAFNKFEDLSMAEQPFGLFLLTLDTHGSDNHFSDSCREITYADGKNGMLNAVACSDFLIHDFIHRVRKSPYYKNTVIVVASDHKAMRNSAYGMLRKSHESSNLFLIFDPETESGHLSNKRGSTLDIGPTLFNVLGFRSYLGLGRDLLADEPTVLEGVKHIDTTLKGWRKEIMKLWSFPEINKSIIVDSLNKTLQINDRIFNTPVLARYDDNLQVEMWFELYNSPHHKTLLENLMEFTSDAPFILVNNCKSLPDEWTGSQMEGLCLVSGKLGSSEFKTENIANTKLLTVKQLQMVVESPIAEGMFNSRVKQIAFAMKRNKIEK